MNYNLLRHALYMGLSGLFIHPGNAQLSDSLFPLEEVQIVSDRLGLPETVTGRHVSVIRSDDITKLPVSTLDELLRYIPFMEVQSRGPFGSQSDILMRGSTFNQVLVMIDGMRINDPLTGHFNSYIPVSLSEISRIEVYRGPAATGFGPDAVGGVVNIITRSFKPGNHEPDGIDGRLEGWIGENNLKRTNSGINMQKGRWRAGLGISYNSSDGHRLDVDSLRGDFNILSTSVSLSGQLTENLQLALRSAYDDRLFNARYFYTNSPLDLSREHVRKWWNQAQIHYRINESQQLSLAAAYKSTRDSFLFNPDFTANLHRTRFQNYQLNHRIDPFPGFRLASGLQLEKREIFSNDRGDRIHWHAGTYITAHRTFTGGLSAGAAMRFDYDPVYGLELLPQLNLSYAFEAWNFRFAGGRSIRSPDFTERFISTGLHGPLSPGRNLGNPDLVAEKSWSLEGGIDRRLPAGILVRLTGFYRFGRDLIDYVFTNSDQIPENDNLIPSEGYFYARNIGLLNTLGIETEINGEHRVGTSWWLDWGIAYQGLSTSSDSALVSKYLASHSRNLLNARLGMGSAGFRFQLTTMYKQRDAWIAEQINQELEAVYMLWNLRMDKFFRNKRIQLSLQVNNLFNVDFADIMGARMPGRWILGGLTWNFNRTFK